MRGGGRRRRGDRARWPTASSAAPRRSTSSIRSNGDGASCTAGELDRRGSGRAASTAPASTSVLIRSVLTCETRDRRLRQVLRPRSRARHAWSISARRSASSPRSRSASRARSSPCAPSTSAARRSAAPSSRSVEAAFDAKVQIKNRNVVVNSEGVPIVMGRNCEIVLLDEAGPREGAPPRALRRQAAGRRRHERDQGPEAGRMGSLHACRSSPRRDGIAHYVDLVEGVSMREVRRRGDRHLVQGRHRLEAAAARRRSEARASR